MAGERHGNGIEREAPCESAFKDAKTKQCGDHRTISLRGYLREELRGNLRTYLENITMDLKEENKLRM